MSCFHNVLFAISVHDEHKIAVETMFLLNFMIFLLLVVNNNENSSHAVANIILAISVTERSKTVEATFQQKFLMFTF